MKRQKIYSQDCSNTESSDESITDQIFAAVFRSDFSQPGFIALELGCADSFQIRSRMIELKKALSDRLSKQCDQVLDYEWLGRFDQQVSTPFHRDNAGDSSYLMLGYEPSEVESQLFFADYTRFISDRELTPDQFYQDYNPLFVDIETELADYVSEVEFGDFSSSRIVIINNSAPSSPSKGVFHKAVVPKPDPSKIRLINSMMLNAVAADADMKFGPETESQYPLLEGVTSMVRTSN